MILVDWKTGPRPTGRAADVAALQLSAYRVAYARLQGLAPQKVRAAFYYALEGRTVYPDLAPPEHLERVLRSLGSVGSH